MGTSSEPPLTAVIIDDEPGSIATLAAMLERYCPTVNILRTFEYPDEAIRELPSLRPDLLFLDVEMPDINGFGVLDVLKNQLQAEVIFTTAYPEYEERAFKYAALRFLVKPIRADQLKEAVGQYSPERAKEQAARFNVLLENRGKPLEEQALVFDAFESEIQFAQPEEQMLFLDELNSKIHFIQPADQPTNVVKFSTSNLRITTHEMHVPGRDGITIIKLEQIVHILAIRGYSMIFCANGLRLPVTRTLSKLDELLTGDGMPFFRTHESHIIGRKYIKNYKLGEMPEIEMEHKKEKIPLARRRKKAFVTWIKS